MLRCRAVAWPAMSAAPEIDHDPRAGPGSRGALRAGCADARRGAGGTRAHRHVPALPRRTRRAGFRGGRARRIRGAGRAAGVPAGSGHGGGGSVQVVMRGLAPTSGDKVYEAWVIAGQNAPVPIGSFTVGSDGTGYLAAGGAPAGAGVTVALTLEPGPGAKTPTPPIISAGVAS